MIVLLAALVACTGPTVETGDSADPDTSVPECPDLNLLSATTVTGTLLTEASGLVHGSGDVFWAHNDSGDTARVMALSRNGDALGTVALDGIIARDWEDIAVLRTAEHGTRLVIADLGDNNRIRTNAQLVLVPEPAAPGAGASTTVNNAVTIAVSFTTGPQDVEAIAVDPIDNRLLVFSKGLDGSTVFTAEPGWWELDALELVPERHIAFGEAPLVGSPAVTGADIRDDGGAVLIRTYSGAWWFRRAPGTVFAAFDSEPCEAPAALEQGEAIAFDGADYFTLPEGVDPELVRYGER